MEVRTTKVFKAILQAWNESKRRVKLEGGTWSSKTYSVLQALQVIAEKAEIPLDISIVSESLPHLKQGCIRDFFNIMGEDKDTSPFYNKTDHIYKRPDWKGKSIFFGADDDSKVRGPRRHILFINEANNIPWETARALDIRTELFTILDWNPVGEFWAHENWLEEDVNAYDHSTYLDALDVIPSSKVTEIESYRDKDPNWWNIYGLGLIGKIEGLVYPVFDQVDFFDGDVFYGLDFGYSNDPTALIKCSIKGDVLYSQELIYETGLTNQDIANKMVELGIKKRYDEIFADSAEPKSIEEIYRYGFNIKPASKGPKSVEFGHQLVRQYKHYWTKDSINGIKEQRNFRYIQDKNGKLTEKTTHSFSHLMDARRYAMVGKLSPKEEEKIVVLDAMKEFGLDRI